MKLIVVICSQPPTFVSVESASDTGSGVQIRGRHPYNANENVYRQNKAFRIVLQVLMCVGGRFDHRAAENTERMDSRMN